ncbi:hypothetical protein P4E94_08735 [Pontiellaceae bacterium B12219]|nr:hypothetical protein [Pontiellaceae bacterium B12219]
MRASTRHEAPSDGDGIFESFSDMVLCTVIVLITLVVVLALNVVEQLNVYIEPNHFSGGATRPWIYLQAQQADYSKTTAANLSFERAVYGDQPFVMVNLFSPNSANTKTSVEDGLVSAEEGQSFHGQYDLTAFNFLQLAAGIEPGTFPVNGNPTALLLPKFSHKDILLETGVPNGYTAKSDSDLALKTMALAWPVYNQQLFPRRAAKDYLHARTKIFVEVLDSTEDTHRIMIGHTVFTLPQDIENGRLGWLAGFSSGLTEVVYLGEAWSDPAARTNKRIEFFEQNGFEEAAAAYRAFSFPEALNSQQQTMVRKLASIGPNLTQAQLENYVRSAEAQQNISRAIINGGDAGSSLPPLLAHKDAWKAYTESCIQAELGTTPPAWLMSEFLVPLGFDQAVVRGLRDS